MESRLSHGFSILSLNLVGLFFHPWLLVLIVFIVLYMNDDLVHNFVHFLFLLFLYFWMCYLSAYGFPAGVEPLYPQILYFLVTFMCI